MTSLIEKLKSIVRFYNLGTKLTQISILKNQKVHSTSKKKVK